MLTIRGGYAILLTVEDGTTKSTNIYNLHNVSDDTDKDITTMTQVITGAWTPLTTDIETHVGLQFGTTITEAIELVKGENYVYRNIAKRDITRGEDVDFKGNFDSYYEVDGERLVQIAKYSTGKNTIQCYNGKNGILSDTPIYYTGRGNIFVAENRRTVRQQSGNGSPVVRTDIFANAKRA